MPNNTKYIHKGAPLISVFLEQQRENKKITQITAETNHQHHHFQIITFLGNFSPLHETRKCQIQWSFDSQVMLIIGTHVKCIRYTLQMKKIAHNYSAC